MYYRIIENESIQSRLLVQYWTIIAARWQLKPDSQLRRVGTRVLMVLMCRAVSIKSCFDWTLFFWYHIITKLQQSLSRIDYSSIFKSYWLPNLIIETTPSHTVHDVDVNATLSCSFPSSSTWPTFIEDNIPFHSILLLEILNIKRLDAYEFTVEMVLWWLVIAVFTVYIPNVPHYHTSLCGPVSHQQI